MSVIDLFPDLELEFEHDENTVHLVHIVCCTTWDLPPSKWKSLCGAVINSLAPPVAGRDVECKTCESLANLRKCPIGNVCPPD